MKATKYFVGVSPKLAYQWVKTGHWNLADFNEWLKVLKNENT